MTNLAFDVTPERDETAPRTADARPIPRITIQAFCDTPEIAGTIETAAADRRMARAHVKVHTGGLDAAAEFYRTRADAQPDPGRDAGCRFDELVDDARQPRRGLRRRHQGHGDRPLERRAALSRAPEARRLRISGRAGRRDVDHRRRSPASTATRHARSSARSTPSSAPRAASAPPRSPTTSPGRWRA